MFIESVFQVWGPGLVLSVSESRVTHCHSLSHIVTTMVAFKSSREKKKGVDARKRGGRELQNKHLVLFVFMLVP